MLTEREGILLLLGMSTGIMMTRQCGEAAAVDKLHIIFLQVQPDVAKMKELGELAKFWLKDCYDGGLAN